MHYVINYDIVGLVLLCLLYILNYSATKAPSRTTKLFRLFIIASFVGAFFDVFTVWTNHYTDTPLMLFINNVLAVIHIASVGVIPAIYYIFILTITSEQKKISKSKLTFTAILYGIDFLVIATSPFTHLIMYYNEKGEYVHGPAFIFTYIAIILFLLAGVIELSVNYKRITKKQFFIVLSYTLVDLIAAYYQFKNPEILLLGFSSATSLMIVSFALKNPMELIDNNTGIFNRTAFKEFLYTSKNTGIMAIIHLRNADSIKYIHGLDNGYNIIKKCIAKLLKECNQKLAFYIFENTIVLICKDEQDAQKKLAIISKYKNNPFYINIDSDISHNISVFIETDSYLITDNQIFQKAIDDKSTKNTHDQVLDILQFLIESDPALDDIKIIDSNFISQYKEKIRIQKIVDNALKNEGFEVFLQPIMDLKARKFTGAESLIRLRDPANGGMISPGLFIPEAEKNGKIIELGDISIKKTCEFIRNGNLAELGIEKVNINLSMVQCMQENIVEHLISIIDSYNIPRSMIRFEITETMTSTNPDKLKTMMTSLASYGIEFALDDYGTGYSNTSRLLTFPFSEIKFDKSFVDSAIEDDRNGLLLKHLMTMVHDTNMIVLVEGVETKETSDLIESYGGELIQGFYYSKPLPFNEFIEFIKNNKFSDF